MWARWGRGARRAPPRSRRRWGALGPRVSEGFVPGRSRRGPGAAAARSRVGHALQPAGPRGSDRPGEPASERAAGALPDGGRRGASGAAGGARARQPQPGRGLGVHGGGRRAAAAGLTGRGRRESRGTEGDAGARPPRTRTRPARGGADGAWPTGSRTSALTRTRAGRHYEGRGQRGVAFGGSRAAARGRRRDKGRG